jgi:hypothetical protein
MTELDHGLDIINMETTATMMSNGEWDLHTPHDRAAKYAQVLPMLDPCLMTSPDTCPLPLLSGYHVLQLCTLELWSMAPSTGSSRSSYPCTMA